MTDSLAVDALWMKEAVVEAEKARAQEEVPVGALLVRDGRVIGRGYNVTEQQQDPTGHAEMMAIRQAALRAESRRLLDATLYVTLEPCAMCAGAIVLARIPRLVFGAFDPKTGACGSLRNVVQDGRLNHRCELIGGVLEEECTALLKRFFSGLRAAGDLK
jgi:tRNA(adenine34) deaminase